MPTTKAQTTSSQAQTQTQTTAKKNKPSITIVVPPNYSSHLDHQLQQQRRLAYLPHTTRLSYDSLPISSHHHHNSTTITSPSSITTTSTTNHHKTSYADRRKSAGALPRLTPNTYSQRDDLSNRIADSFQEFSNMLTQLSAAKEQQKKKPPVLPATPSSRKNIVETPKSLAPLQQQQSNKIRQSSGSLASLPFMTSPLSSWTTTSALAMDDLCERSDNNNNSNNSSSSSSSNSTSSRTSNNNSNTTDDERETNMLFMVSNAATTRRPKVTVVPTPHNEKEEEELDDTRKKIMQRLSRAVCIDDAQTIKSVLQEQNENTWVDINHPDELGITLLIHAACFNSLQVIRPLLEAGAKIDKPDKKGWTALLWAINNHHIDMVKLLLDCGASCDIKTSKGYTIHRWVDPKDETMFKILPSPPMTMTTTTSPTSSQKIKKASLQRKQESSSPSLPSSKKKKRRASTIPKLDQVDLIYFQADMFGYAGMTPSSTTKNTRRSSTISHTSIASKEDEEEIEPDKDNEEETEESSSEDEDLEGWEGCIRSIYQFDWNKCLPDQMFVFCQDDMSHILDIAIHDVKLPLPPSSSDDILFCTANIIFLCCRFAHYHSKRDLLQAFLTLAINKMAKAIKANPRNIDSLSYWIANTHRLFQYLRRDQGLVDTTRDEQQRISHLLSEAFSLLVSFTQKRLDKLIEPALLEYEEIAQEQPIDFVEDMTSWQRFFRRSSTSSVTSLTSNNNNTPSSSRPNSFLLSTPAATPSATIPTPSSSSPSSMTPPSTLTSIITSITQTMEGYDIHYKIKEQLIMQCLQYIASQGFQRLLANKKYLCRSRAIHVRMNVSSMEEWIRHTLGHSVYTCFQPLAQLLQLLQCVSQLHDLLLFQDTTAGFDLLEPAHIRRCVLHYRYEINEPQLPEGVFTFVQQSPTTTTTTTTSLLSPRNSICSNHTTPSSHSHSNNNSRNPSLDMSSSTRISTDEDMSTADWLVACNHSSMGELIVPTEPLKRDHGCVPSIPEVWMFKLDKK